MLAEVFEAFMLLSFSVSWYCSIWKMLRTRTAAGKSFAFVCLICTGYLAGIAAKLTVWQTTGHLAPVVALYCWNFLVTSFDAWLVWRFTAARRIVPGRQRVGACL